MPSIPQTRTLVANRVVTTYLSEGRSQLEYPIARAAGECLRSQNPQWRQNGAKALARLADEGVRPVLPAMYDLLNATTIRERDTQALVLGVLCEFGLSHRDLTRELVSAVEPVTDVESPLVREAAYATLAWSANRSFTNDWAGLDSKTVDQFRAVAESMVELLLADRDDPDTEWTAQFDIDQELTAFNGTVDAGDSRYQSIRRNCGFGLASLGTLVPNPIVENETALAQVALETEAPVTRNYIVDALARAEASEALQYYIDAAVGKLGNRETVSRGLQLLSGFHPDAYPYLADCATALTAALNRVPDDERSTAATVTLVAIGYSDSPPEELLQTLIAQWLTESTAATEYSISLAESTVEEIAANWPEFVYPIVATATDLHQSEQRSLCRLQVKPSWVNVSEVDGQWDAERSWGLLHTLAETDPDRVQSGVDWDQFRDNVETAETVPEYRWKLFGKLVSTPLSTDHEEQLFSALRANRGGSATAGQLIFNRAPAPTIEAACTRMDKWHRPTEESVTFLDEMAASRPNELAPLLPTLQGWIADLSPDDERWNPLATAVGRIALATDETSVIENLLTPLSNDEYCRAVLETSIGAELVTTAPNKTVPSLLSHLSSGSPRLRRAILRTFETMPTELEGWAPRLRSALCRQVESPNESVRRTAVEILGQWNNDTLRNLAETGSVDADTLQNALHQGVSDESVQVRGAAVSALTCPLSTETEACLTQQWRDESHPVVSFRIERLLRDSHA